MHQSFGSDWPGPKEIGGCLGCLVFAAGVVFLIAGFFGGWLVWGLGQ